MRNERVDEFVERFLITAGKTRENERGDKSYGLSERLPKLRSPMLQRQRDDLIVVGRPKLLANLGCRAG
ncbi:hypothetical protein S2M10_00340 [Sphingomonas sp. S2M10]|nr:hypothetical protein [Sphingomonas sp. S2M10]